MLAPSNLPPPTPDTLFVEHGQPPAGLLTPPLPHRRSFRGGFSAPWIFNPTPDKGASAPLAPPTARIPFRRPRLTSSCAPPTGGGAAAEIFADNFDKRLRLDSNGIPTLNGTPSNNPRGAERDPQHETAPQSAPARRCSYRQSDLRGRILPFEKSILIFNSKSLSDGSSLTPSTTAFPEVRLSNVEFYVPHLMYN